MLAFDLGASNGRLMLCSHDGERIRLQELHRFPNHAINVCGHYYWDILRIFQEMKEGIRKSIQAGHHDVSSLAVDTWGVDFGLLSSSGELLGNPYSYRDSQTSDGMEALNKIVTNTELFHRSGVEPAVINTIYQLYAIKQRQPEILDQAETLLLTPNLVSYFFSGVKANEFTISSTTSLMNYKNGDWDDELMELLKLPSSIMAPIVKPGTILGPTLDSINKELEMDPIEVVAVAGHDTASALAALPIKDENAVFMSCGTWILIGTQVKEPIVTEESLDWGFTNEGTIDGEYRLLKNNMGLWLIQQCKLMWSREDQQTTYEEDNQLVRDAKPFKSFINPDDPSFFHPENMLKEIQNFVEKSGQQSLETKGEFLRCILESLALKYRWVIDRLEHLTGKPINTIHMGGGGIKNEWLCQFTANATNRKVITGPVEASSIGNAIGQFIALGEIKDLKEAREVVGRSFQTKEYEPQNQKEWQDAYERFVKFVK
ncbi:rhamnulokinase family protein [Gracilibacillus sp. YIM 98692]|uniref:rhamnulokinase n=1 Tax=Gracilibacillus sp. YIM 98692 TaxID=2663532 RepID=UPI001F08E498|nr:rhamnulokinase family protein [Gracilibacillus sp. YIM 98692]